MAGAVLRCSACGKPLRKPSATIGRMVLGPICARKAGLTLRATKRAIRAAARTRQSAAAGPGQMDLFLGAPA